MAVASLPRFVDVDRRITGLAAADGTRLRGADDTGDMATPLCPALAGYLQEWPEGLVEEVGMGTGPRETALAPVISSTRRAGVTDAIRRALLTGELVPGQRVKESRLAETLGVSRPTVRDAVSQLVHEGALVQTPYKGITVARPSAQDLLDVAEVRVSLETLSAIHLSRYPDGEGMARLREALRHHLDAIEADDLVRVDMTHLDFHRTLWEMSENQMLMRIWPLVESQIRMAMSLDQVTLSNLARDADLHQRLVDAIANGDEEEIAAEVRDHIASSAYQVVALMQDQGIGDAAPSP